ncbi:MAG: hypothetical protein H7Z73_06880 [Candidatus Saccharibacteria bacterium]|nr:hypothetical protein [Moraxellaceae bacterium]
MKGSWGRLRRFAGILGMSWVECSWGLIRCEQACIERSFATTAYFVEQRSLSPLRLPD